MWIIGKADRPQRSSIPRAAGVDVHPGVMGRADVPNVLQCVAGRRVGEQVDHALRIEQRILMAARCVDEEAADDIFVGDRPGPQMARRVAADIGDVVADPEGRIAAVPSSVVLIADVGQMDLQIVRAAAAAQRAERQGRGRRVGSGRGHELNLVARAGAEGARQVDRPHGVPP